MNELSREDQCRLQQRAAQQRYGTPETTRPSTGVDSASEARRGTSSGTRRGASSGTRHGASSGAGRGETARRTAPRGAVENQRVRHADARSERRQARPADGRPVRTGANSPTRRQTRPADERPGRRATRPASEHAERRATRPAEERPARAGENRPTHRQTRPETRGVVSSKHSLIAEPGDEFSIENINPAYRQNVSLWRQWTTRVFAALMTLGLVVGLLFFARPTMSAIENRSLTPFPAFTVEGVLDGSFFSGVSTWYADTYPMREVLVSFDHWLEGFFGIQSNTMMIGGSAVSQDIPENGEGNTEAASAEAAAKKEVEPPSVELMAEEIQNSIMDGLYVKDGAAYSRYYFVQESVETYTSALNLAAERLDGTTRVYSILAPNNSGAMLSEEELAQLGGADQKKATDYFGSLYSDKVTLVDTYDTLRSHNSEYLYFRTDHHWTALGAYYAYENFCAASGKQKIPLEDRQSVTFEPFLGAFYGQLELDAMAANPDYVTAYYPLGTNDMTYWDGGEEVQYHVITDVSEWNESAKYSTFVAGDKPLSVIENPQINDGSSCLLVKDSFGCAFAPFLVDSYQSVYIIDFRYYDGNIVDFCKEKNVNDLIFLNNLTMATATSVGEAILSEVQ